MQANLNRTQRLAQKGMVEGDWHFALGFDSNVLDICVLVIDTNMRLSGQSKSEQVN